MSLELIIPLLRDSNLLPLLLILVNFKSKGPSLFQDLWHDVRVERVDHVEEEGAVQLLALRLDLREVRVEHLVVAVLS